LKIRSNLAASVGDSVAYRHRRKLLAEGREAPEVLVDATRRDRRAP